MMVFLFIYSDLCFYTLLVGLEEFYVIKVAGGKCNVIKTRKFYLQQFIVAQSDLDLWDLEIDVIKLPRGE